MGYFWMKVDLKNNEEPLAVADSQRELAKMLGVKESSIREEKSRAKRLGRPCCYIRVDDDDDE